MPALHHKSPIIGAACLLVLVVVDELEELLTEQHKLKGDGVLAERLPISVHACVNKKRPIAQ